MRRLKGSATRMVQTRQMSTESSARQDYWNSRLEVFQLKTPSRAVNVAGGLWNQYQCHTTFNWSRSASFIEAGGRDGLGFRDTNQDTLGVVHAVGAAVKSRLVDLLKGQLSFEQQCTPFSLLPSIRDA